MRSVWRGAPVLAALALGCGDSTPPVSQGPLGSAALGSARQAIIGGLVASSPLLDHTGTLTYRVRATGATDALCSASLIAPETLVTAKHCISVMAGFERAGIDLYWTPGPDFTRPLDAIPVVAVAGAPGTEVGFAGYGRDVGVAHLERPAAGTPLLDIAPFSPELLGTSMVTLGFGVSTAAGLVDGLRRVGRETVSQVEGPAYEGLFGDFETYIELLVTGESTPRDILPEVEGRPDLVDLVARRAEYDSMLLMPGHEVVTGKAPGDTQSCELDSGGPLALVNAAGDWVSYGVVSAGPRLPRPICVFGQVFAVFGPITFPFLEAERDWVDPCGDVTAAGRCTGDVLERCESSFATATRRLVEEDCASSGASCVEGAGGAACQSASSAPDAGTAGDAGATPVPDAGAN